MSESFGSTKVLLDRAGIRFFPHWAEQSMWTVETELVARAYRYTCTRRSAGVVDPNYAFRVLKVNINIVCTYQVFQTIQDRKEQVNKSPFSWAVWVKGNHRNFLQVSQQSADICLYTTGLKDDKCICFPPPIRFPSLSTLQQPGLSSKEWTGRTNNSFKRAQQPERKRSGRIIKISVKQKCWRKQVETWIENKVIEF